MLKGQSWVLATETEWATKLKISTMWPFAERFANPLLPSVWTQYPGALRLLKREQATIFLFPSPSQSSSATSWTGCYFFTPLTLYDRSFPLLGLMIPLPFSSAWIIQMSGKWKIRGSESGSVNNFDLKHAKFLNLSSFEKKKQNWFNRINFEPRF